MSGIVLGIDVAKLKFDVALLRDGKYKTKIFKNSLDGFESLKEWLKHHNVENVHACLESTGTYGEALSYYLVDNGFQVSVVNPAQIKGFAQSELLRTKTDKVDAKLIARFCLAMHPSIWKPLPLEIRELANLVKRVEALQGMYREEKNRLEGATETIEYLIKEVCSVLTKQINEVKLKIREHINKNPTLKEQSELLASIPGVGESTISKILSFMCTPERFKSAKQVVAFAGLNPRQRQSGTSVHGQARLSKTGNSSLRKALYLPAVVAKQYNPLLKPLYERLLKAGKPKMLAIGAVMRKLLHLIYGVLKSGRPFYSSLVIF